MNKFLAALLIYSPILIVINFEKYQFIVGAYLIILRVMFFKIKMQFYKTTFRNWTIHNLGLIFGLLAIITNYYFLFTNSLNDIIFLVVLILFTITFIKVEKFD